MPATVAYSAGNVLATDGMGASCEKVPTVSAGWIDPATVRSRLESYFASPESAVDMSRLPVTDLGATSLHYLDAAGQATRSAPTASASTPATPFPKSSARPDPP